MLDSDLLSPGRVLADVTIRSQKHLFELISTTLAEKNKELNPREIFESLCAREQLGSTALGNGIAIPHGRISGTGDVEAIFIKLANPLPFSADDGKAVDLVFAFVAPQVCTSEHSKMLSSVAERFSDPEFLAQLRDASDSNEIWQLLSNPQT